MIWATAMIDHYTPIRMTTTWKQPRYLGVGEWINKL